jgi:hypothetical protein
MPGLLRGVARTAVIAGTATTVSNRVSRRQARRWGAEDQQQQAPPQYAEPQYAEPPPPAEEDPMDKLRELAQLNKEGILTDEEFSAAKAKILGT